MKRRGYPNICKTAGKLSTLGHQIQISSITVQPVELVPAQLLDNLVLFSPRTEFLLRPVKIPPNSLPGLLLARGGLTAPELRLTSRSTSQVFPWKHWSLASSTAEVTVSPRVMHVSLFTTFLILVRLNVPMVDNSNARRTFSQLEDRRSSASIESWHDRSSGTSNRYRMRCTVLIKWHR